MRRGRGAAKPAASIPGSLGRTRWIACGRRSAGCWAGAPPRGKAWRRRFGGWRRCCGPARPKRPGPGSNGRRRACARMAGCRIGCRRPAFPRRTNSPAGMPSKANSFSWRWSTTGSRRTRRSCSSSIRSSSEPCACCSTCAKSWNRPSGNWRRTKARSWKACCRRRPRGKADARCIATRTSIGRCWAGRKGARRLRCWGATTTPRGPTRTTARSSRPCAGPCARAWT